MSGRYCLLPKTIGGTISVPELYNTPKKDIHTEQTRLAFDATTTRFILSNYPDVSPTAFRPVNGYTNLFCALDTKNKKTVYIDLEHGNQKVPLMWEDILESRNIVPQRILSLFKLGQEFNKDDLKTLGMVSGYDKNVWALRTSKRTLYFDIRNDWQKTFMKRKDCVGPRIESKEKESFWQKLVGA